LVSQYGYFAIAMFTGATLTVGAMLLLAARLSKEREILVAF